MRRAGAFALAALALAGCVPASAPPAPRPVPPPAPAPVPAPEPPAPAPTPPPANWQDGPLTPGDWSYRVEAGVPTAAYSGGGASLAVRCAAGGRIDISLMATQGGAIVVRTTLGERRLPASPDHYQIVASLAAADPLLDQMAFSRGRFLVQAEGGASLIVPAWPELARVVEDCRGQ